MKKIAIYFYLFFIFNTANAFETVGKQAILIDYDTNEILYEKNAHEKAFPSSMTKIMTAFIVFEKIHNKEINLSDKFFISNNAWKQEGSRMFLNVGSKVSVDELLKGLLVQSGNDSAVALSEGTFKTVENFVKKMNEKAKEFNLKNTNFTNPVGFSEEEHYMSVFDTAKLSQKLISTFPEFYKKYFSIKEYEYNSIKQKNRNLLLGKFDGVDGVKTGHTKAGGYSISLSAEQNNRRLIAVLNGLNSEKERLEEGEKILSYGFYDLNKFLLYKKNETIKEIPVLFGKKKNIKISTEKDIYATEKNKENIEIIFSIKNEIKAPIYKNQKIGTLVINSLSNQQKYDLISLEKIEEVNIIKKVFLKIYYFIINLM